MTASRTIAAKAVEIADLRWPSAESDETLNYSVDFSAALASGETTNIVTWAVSPDDGLTLSATAVSGTVATCVLSGGTPGRDYRVKVRMFTNVNRYERIISYFTALTDGPFPPLSVSRLFGPVTYWRAAQPLSLNKKRPLSVSNLAAAF